MGQRSTALNTEDRIRRADDRMLERILKEFRSDPSREDLLSWLGSSNRTRRSGARKRREG